MNKTIDNLEQNVDQIIIGDKKIILVGTAHISQASIDLTKKIIEQVKPDAVAVELCSSRYESLQNPDRWRNTDIIKVLKEGKAVLLLFQLILASYQKKLGDKLNVKPGAEMMEAINCAKSLNIPIILADRDVKTTLKRAWHEISFLTLVKLFLSSVWESFVGIFKNSKKSLSLEEEIESLKNNDALELMMNEFSQALPDVKGPLIDERDQYLSEKVFNHDYKTVVAIVGAGHVTGIKKIIGSAIELAELEKIPSPKLSSKILSYLFPVLLIVFLIAGFFSGGSEKTLELAWTWVLYTGVCSAIGALLAIAHPLSILTAGIVAPITTVHPLLAAGWFAGFVEAILRKPSVLDVENILNDISSLKGIWTNKLARVFLVMILTNLTASIGMIWATKVIAYSL